MSTDFYIDGERVIVRASVAALVFGVGVRTLNQWVKKGCPREKKAGYYDLRSVIEWRHATDNSPDSLEAKKQKADIRYREARANMAELNEKITLGEYIAVDDIKDELTDVFTRVRGTLLNIKQKTVAQLYTSYPDVAHDVGTLVETEIERGLKQLATRGAKLKEFDAEPGRGGDTKTRGR